MNNITTVLTLDQLGEFASAAHTREIFSPLGEQHYLLADLRAQSMALLSSTKQEIRAWLQQLPCPTIAIADAHPLSDAFDIVVESLDDTKTLLSNIERTPIAAMTLVQVLRCTAMLPATEGLLVESLAYATLQAGPEFQAWSRVNPPTTIEIQDVGPALLIQREGNTLSAQLNRPSRRNAISVEIRDALTELFQLVTTDMSLQHTTISGNGACFSVGGDVDEFGTTPDAATAHAIRSLRLPARYLLACANRVAFHVHSACIGAGIEIPAFGHRVTATRNAFFQLPEIRFGLIPGAGGCVSIPARIGRQRAAYMALSAKKINATTALQWGLIDAIID